MQRQLRLFFALLLLAYLGLFVSGALAQPDVDPSTAPVPDFTVADPARALIISVFFHSETDLEILDVRVANTRARSHGGGPPLILIELMNRDGNVQAQQNVMHPLWEFHETEEGGESKQELPSGPGTFLIPLSGSLGSVKISDQRRQIALIEVPVQDVVTNYCDSSPDSPICDDSDGDGVVNTNDSCDSTTSGSAVDPRNGCSVSQLCPCDGPRDSTDSWKNHGKLVECVSRTARDFRTKSLITNSEFGKIVSSASSTLSCVK